MRSTSCLLKVLSLLHTGLHIHVRKLAIGLNILVNDLAAHSYSSVILPFLIR